MAKGRRKMGAGDMRVVRWVVRWCRRLNSVEMRGRRREKKEKEEKNEGAKRRERRRHGGGMQPETSG